MAEIPFGTSRTMYWEVDLESSENIPSPESVFAGAGSSASFFGGPGFFVPTLSYIPSSAEAAGPDGFVYAITSESSPTYFPMSFAQWNVGEGPGNWQMGLVQDEGGLNISQVGFGFGSSFLVEFDWFGSQAITTGDTGTVDGPTEIPSITGSGPEVPYTYEMVIGLPFAVTTQGPGAVVFATVEAERSYYILDYSDQSLSAITTPFLSETNLGSYGAMIYDSANTFLCITDTDDPLEGGILTSGTYLTYTFEEHATLGVIDAIAFARTFVLATDGVYFYSPFEYQDIDDNRALAILEIEREGVHYNVIYILPGNAPAQEYWPGYQAGTAELSVSGNSLNGALVILGGEWD